MREAMGWTLGMLVLFAALAWASGGCAEGEGDPADDDAGDDDAGDDDAGDDDAGDDDTSGGEAVVLWAGGPSDSADVPFPHCVYRQPIGGDPEAVVCEDAEEFCRILSFTAPPDPVHRTAIVATELLVGHDCQNNPYPEYDDVYDFGVQELWRVDLDGGEAELWSHHLAANFFGEPHRYVEAVGWLPDGRAVLDIMGFHIVPGASVSREIVVLDADGERSGDLLPDHGHKELVGVMADGGVVIETDDPAAVNDGQLWWIDPDTGDQEVLVPADGQTFGHALVAPDGGAVLYERPELSGGTMRVAVATRTDQARLDPGDADTADLLGWTAGGNVLLERDGQLLTWNGADGGTAQDLAPPSGDGWGEWRVLPGVELAAVQQGHESLGDRLRLVGDDGVDVACGAVGRMDAPQWLSGADEPTAVFGDGEAVRVYLCGEDGQNVDLLAPHGMRGLPLGFEPPLGH